MDSNIYYIPEYEGITITSNFAEIQKRMDIGLDSKTQYIPINISDFKNYKIKSVGFTKVESSHFDNVREIFEKFSFEYVSFHESTIDLSDVMIDCKQLLIGEKTKINLSSPNFTNVEEITFLSVKSFKGSVLDEFVTVKKLVLWDSVKTFSLTDKFPNLEELTLNKGGIIDLDLSKNKDLKRLDIHLCSKLEHILLDESHKLEKVLIENCKNLDVSNLPEEITSIWPPRKNISSTVPVSIKLTGDQEIDSLISDLQKNMEDYMKDADPSYNQKDIDKCISILIDFNIAILTTKSKDEGMKLVKSTILKLNSLNGNCDFSLIETNEREKIAEIIILAGNKMNYNSLDEDITEEWREW